MAERTRTRTVTGTAYVDDEGVVSYMEGDVIVSVTKDDAGKSLSLSFGNMMLEIPVEPVEDMVDIVEGKKKKKAIDDDLIHHVGYEPWQLGREQ